MSVQSPAARAHGVFCSPPVRITGRRVATYRAKKSRVDEAVEGDALDGVRRPDGRWGPARVLVTQGGTSSTRRRRRRSASSSSRPSLRRGGAIVSARDHRRRPPVKRAYGGRKSASFGAFVGIQCDLSLRKSERRKSSTSKGPRKPSPRPTVGAAAHIPRLGADRGRSGDRALLSRRAHTATPAGARQGRFDKTATPRAGRVYSILKGPQPCRRSGRRSRASWRC